MLKILFIGIKYVLYISLIFEANIIIRIHVGIETINF